MKKEKKEKSRLLYSNVLQFQDGNYRYTISKNASDELLVKTCNDLLRNGHILLPVTWVFTKDGLYNILENDDRHTTKYNEKYEDISHFYYDKDLKYISFWNNDKVKGDIKNRQGKIYCDEKGYKIIEDEVISKMGTDTLVSKSKKAEKKAKIIIASIIAAILIIFIGIIAADTFKTSPFEELSEDEQEWYIDNYGDGKMEDINKAIDEYEE